MGLGRGCGDRRSGGDSLRDPGHPVFAASAPAVRESFSWTSSSMPAVPSLGPGGRRPPRSSPSPPRRLTLDAASSRSRPFAPRPRDRGGRFLHVGELVPTPSIPSGRPAPRWQIDPAAWATTQFATAQLGDRRRTARLVTLATADRARSQFQPARADPDVGRSQGRLSPAGPPRSHLPGHRDATLATHRASRPTGVGS